MPTRGPSKRSDDQFANGETGVTVHGYRISAKPALDPATELRLVADIHQGKTAFDEIATAMTAEIATHLATRDLAPLLLDEQQVGRLVRGVVVQQVIKHATKDNALMVIGNAVANAIQHAIGDLLESADLLPEFPFEEWIEQKLPQHGVAQLLSTVLRDRADHWQAVSLREIAIELLIETHIWIAVPFARSAMRQRFEFGDLMNEAVLILRQAADGYDPESGNRFSSYAKAALKKELWRRSPTEIGVTRHTGEQVRTYYRTRRTMMQEQGHSVTVDDVYDQLACPDGTRTEIENARRLLIACRRAQPKSDMPRYDAADTQLPNPLHETVGRESVQRLLAAFSTLPAIEKRIVVGHCIRGMSFREMAKRFQKSPHTLSDLCKGALLKLARHIDPTLPNQKPR